MGILNFLKDQYQLLPLGNIIYFPRVYKTNKLFTERPRTYQNRSHKDCNIVWCPVFPCSILALLSFDFDFSQTSKKCVCTPQICCTQVKTAAGNEKITAATLESSRKVEYATKINSKVNRISICFKLLQTLRIKDWFWKWWVCDEICFHAWYFLQCYGLSHVQKRSYFLSRYITLS